MSRKLVICLQIAVAVVIFVAIGLLVGATVGLGPQMIVIAILFFPLLYTLDSLMMRLFETESEDER